jgi:ArsR family transcriptional regulator
MSIDYPPDSFLKAISEPTRLRIILLLSQYEELCVCDLQDVFGVPQPKVSRHLKALRNTFIVLPRKEGLWIHYRLHPELPDWALATIDTLFRGCQQQQPYAADRQTVEGNLQKKKSPGSDPDSQKNPA